MSSIPRPLLAFCIFTGAALALAPTAALATHYVIAFHQQNGLPANVDKMVADAGGTIVERLPELGGIGVESTNPNFLAKIGANSSVKSADTATETSLDPTWNRADPSASSSTDNGGTFSPTGSDTQAMPDSLGLLDSLERTERSLIDEALRRAGGNKAAAARLLGINRTTLIEKLKRRRE